MRSIAICSLVLLATPVAAQPAVEELVDQAEPTTESYEQTEPLQRSYLIPTVEVVTLNVGLHLAARAAGQDWAQATPETMRENVSGGWVWDQDPFSINQLAHPYSGATLFATARSTGHEFWVSTAYAFGGSLAWEVLAESEPPSINDQITTSFGGAFLGEAIHRWGRAVLWGGGARPGTGRRVLAAVIDPMGSANSVVFGEFWRRVPPPRLYAALAVGWSQQLDDAARTPFHAELAVRHGLPSDPRFEPRVPFDHFDLHAQIDASTDDVFGYLDLRGIVFGRAFGEPGNRALWGLYGTYDYWGRDGTRASALGVGPGIASHHDLGNRLFLQTAAVVTLVPWGAAGGYTEVEGPARDYQHGPGAAGLVEVELGRRGVGVLRLAARAIDIEGRIVGDANEAVVMTSAGVVVAPAAHQAFGVDVTYAAHNATFTDAAMDAFDQSTQLRLTYAVISDRMFGGGAD